MEHKCIINKLLTSTVVTLSLLDSLFHSFAVLLNVFAAAAAAKLLPSCPTLCDPIDGSPPGSPIPGILQARVGCHCLLRQYIVFVINLLHSFCNLLLNFILYSMGFCFFVFVVVVVLALIS